MSDYLFEEGFVDMDGTIADFIKRALLIHGRKDMANGHIPYPLGKNVEEVLELHQNEVDKAKFWHPIHEDGYSFWESLEPFSWAKQLFTSLAPCCRSIKILTSPGRDQNPATYFGKRSWLIKHGFGDYEFLPFKSKYLVAGPKRLLIDDDEEHVNQFRSCNGFAILFPSVSNHLYAHASSPMFYLGMEMGHLIRELTATK